MALELNKQQVCQIYFHDIHFLKSPDDMKSLFGPTWGVELQSPCLCWYPSLPAGTRFWLLFWWCQICHSCHGWILQPDCMIFACCVDHGFPNFRWLKSLFMFNSIMNHEPQLTFTFFFFRWVCFHWLIWWLNPRSWLPSQHKPSQVPTMWCPQLSYGLWAH